MCGGSEKGSYVRLIDFLDHSTLGSSAIKRKKMLRALAYVMRQLTGLGVCDETGYEP